MHLLLLLLSCLLVLPQAMAASSVTWAELNHMEATGANQYHTTGHDPWMQSEALETPIDAERSILHLRIQAEQAADAEVRWLMPGDQYAPERTLTFALEATGEAEDYFIDLDQRGSYEGLETLRIDPAHGAGVAFRIAQVAFLSPAELPEAALADLVDFRGYSSKLHYLQGEAIDYIMRVGVHNYPDQSSAKTLDVYLLDAAGDVRAHAVQQWGIQPGYRIREIPGRLEATDTLEPGGYTLRFVAEDLRSGLRMEHEHAIKVLGEDAPFVYETPFKYIKDFSIIQDDEGLFHIFSITGDFYSTHEWMPNGQERTLSHGTSRDLRHWEYHRPVLSIHDKTYPDSEVPFQDQGVWAPHVIRHEGLYYMFYTSVNTHVSQSVSVAVSEDLFHWEEHSDNPVFNLDGVDWAVWARDSWADCRDPMVLEDDDGTFYLYVTAVADTEHGHTGAVAVAESRDLIHWENPQVALETPPVPESPHVFKSGERYYLYTSAAGGGIWESDHPVTGWTLTDIPRMPTQEYAAPLSTSAGYAEEVVRLDNGELLVAAVTFRHFGNTIYLARLTRDADGRPTGYESPFAIDGK